MSMNDVRRFGKLQARIVAIEDRLDVVEAELVDLRLPLISFDTNTELKITTRIDRIATITFDSKTGMNVWGTTDSI